MKTRNARNSVLLLFGTAAMLLCGCGTAQQPTGEPAKTEVADASDETSRVAEQALGSRAEILAQGDLAKNGLQQILVVNRAAGITEAGKSSGEPSGIFVTRAAVLQKNGAAWTELLRCDERLKNPNGYLGGSPAARVAGWWLEFKQDARQGLEMKFTPANFGAGEQDSGTGESVGRSLVVRWNTRAKRYQSLDASKEGYLSEAPTLETPHSVLK